ncbi:TIGR03862 family flavoprotein [Palleronia sediminis]|uniref:TIGR03862 family flavoprotein n=2 Tax=Palleronia sediminis TaxID=2547833 RepID=A0A4R5ZYZ4_9RHOB|nr:TIGR03862 family flavoprotein [Palleronia sediminis]TDL75257.1 TIGR03862 family flavoprotein [Palleronia sediminis]
MEQARAWVIGGGPAGLMAAETLARRGHCVTVAEAMPTLGRKFLMAGKSGLNLTKNEPPDLFASRYGDGSGPLPELLGRFGPAEMRAWAEDLGQPLFTGSTGRVFPVAMKASPLLRAWRARLEADGVRIATRWRWCGWDGGALAFDTPEGRQGITPAATVLALGGASWRRLGSDGAWVPWLAARGVEIVPWAPANAGLKVRWSNHVAPHFGAPIKGAALLAGDTVHRGEFVISRRGLEGGGIYAVLRAVREGAALTLDLAPDRTAAELAARIGSARGSIGNRLRKAAKLAPPALALLMEFGRPLPADPHALAALTKAVPLRHDGPRPLDEAISSAGGIAWSAVDDGLMLRAVPGVFAAGEMLDWEAPTGGYLLTACFATGLRAGEAAARWIAC